MNELSQWSQLLGSSKLVWVCDLFCAFGALAAVLAAVSHARAAFARRDRRSLVDWLPIAFQYATGATLGAWVFVRWREVNHFPSQTMAEVVTMATLSLVLSMIVLHHALGLRRRSPAWAVLDDVLQLTIFGGVAAIHGLFLRTLVTAQRDLPPALQSYWFPPHLSSLIFSYGMLTLAGVICLVYFVTRFWGGVFGGGPSRRSQLLLLAVLLFVPFVHIVTVPALLLGGLVFLVLRLTGHLPSVDARRRMEKDLDEVSFVAFSCGIPFLTAGLFMGAFWAQEAWANYWGWDSKENSALITWLVYVAYIHLRLLGGYRGEKAMAVLMGGALSVFVTFQVFGYLPDSQKSLHRYTDDGVTPQEGMQGDRPAPDQSASRDPRDLGDDR